MDHYAINWQIQSIIRCVRVFVFYRCVRVCVFLESSVHSWERLGAFICQVGRRLLHLVLLRYRNDYCAAERSACERHAMHCFARLAKAMLGPTAVCHCQCLVWTFNLMELAAPAGRRKQR